MHLLTLSRPRALALALMVAGALLLGGRYLARSGATAARPVETVRAVAAPARPKLTVHVVGAVRRPGLYELREGTRVADAVERAGGATPKAQLELINLAAPVADGAQIVVPRRLGVPGAPAGAASPTPNAGVKLSLNQATVEQLDELPGVGPVTAQKIVDFRAAHGAIASIDDLDAVPGIGPARLEQLRELVTP